MSPRSLLFTLLAALALAALPAPAHADHHHWWHDDDPSADWSDETTVPDTTVPDTTVPDTAPREPALPPLATTKQPMVKGRVAVLRTDGRAAIPHDAPKQIRNIIRAANEIVGKPYKWGGGHAKLIDRGYDCSGSVGYALIRNGLLHGPMVSGQMARAFRGKPGRWLTIYANKGHVYMEVAGLRFDTSPVGDWYSRRSGPRWRPAIGKRRGFHVRHVPGL
jgi:cell wall-associated NlpC family hydrolase